MKLFKCCAVVLGVGILPQAYAEEPVLTEGMMSIGIPVFVEDRNTFMITGKRMISVDEAVIVGAGLREFNNRYIDSNSSVKDKSKAFSLSGGYRKYLDKDWLNTYWESSGHLSYSKSESPFTMCNPSCTSGKSKTYYQNIGATIRLGGEHFFSKHFSVEGSAGVSFDYESTRNSGGQDTPFNPSTKSFRNRISSNFSSLNLNYYWK